MIITIDGPASSGKGTIAKKLAAKLGYIYLDTGSMYRSITYYCLQHGIDVHDEAAVVAVLKDIQLSFDTDFAIYVNGENVGEKIRTDEISSLTSNPVSTYEAVREDVVAKERAMAQEQPNIVIDGRDSGSVVFPQADIKFFISASLIERARRRALQNAELGEATDVAVLEAELAKRDHDDIMRPLSPLRVSANAVIVDTTNLDVDQTLQYVYNYVQAQK